MSRAASRRLEQEKLSKTPEGRAELARREAAHAAEIRKMESREFRYQITLGWIAKIVIGIMKLCGVKQREPELDAEWEEHKRKNLEMVAKWKQEEEPPRESETRL